MTEAVPDGESGRTALIALLDTDFSSQGETPTDSLLGRFIATTRPAEEVAERSASDENAELGAQVERALGAAAITESFKGYIAYEVQHAHAWSNPVSEAVSPDQLGLRSGAGIFDPSHSQDIETYVIRGYLYEIIKEHVRLPETRDGDELPPELLNPHGWSESMQRFTRWETDYQETYGKDAFAFAGEGKSVFFAAAQHAVVDGSWREIVERLEEERRRQDE